MAGVVSFDREMKIWDPFFFGFLLLIWNICKTTREYQNEQENNILKNEYLGSETEIKKSVTWISSFDSFHLNSTTYVYSWNFWVLQFLSRQDTFFYATIILPHIRISKGQEFILAPTDRDQQLFWVNYKESKMRLLIWICDFKKIGWIIHLISHFRLTIELEL